MYITMFKIPLILTHHCQYHLLHSIVELFFVDLHMRRVCRVALNRFLQSIEEIIIIKTIMKFLQIEDRSTIKLCFFYVCCCCCLLLLFVGFLVFIYFFKDFFVWCLSVANRFPFEWHRAKNSCPLRVRAIELNSSD